MNINIQDEQFNEWFETKYPNISKLVALSEHDALLFKSNQYDAWCASQSRGSHAFVPVEPTEDQWGGLARVFGRYMQNKDRYCPKTLKRHLDMFADEIPEWLNKEVPNWESGHAFATADLPVFIYKSMVWSYLNENSK